MLVKWSPSIRQLDRFGILSLCKNLQNIGKYWGPAQMNINR